MSGGRLDFLWDNTDLLISIDHTNVITIPGGTRPESAPSDMTRMRLGNIVITHGSSIVNPSGADVIGFVALNNDYGRTPFCHAQNGDNSATSAHIEYVYIRPSDNMLIAKLSEAHAGNMRIDYVVIGVME